MMFGFLHLEQQFDALETGAHFRSDALEALPHFVAEFGRLRTKYFS